MRRKFLPIIAVVVSLFGLFSTTLVAAQSVPSDFHLQLIPSPIVQSIKPGVPTDLQIQIHNFGSSTENLKIATRKFTVDNKTGNIIFNDTQAPEAAQWVTFSQPTFSVKSGDYATENVHFALPKDTGFSYSFAIVVSRTSSEKVSSGSSLNASVADFTLINVDKPGATRKLDIVDVSTDQQIYEFLPAKINVRFKNVGNTIVAPTGNVFVQRNSSDKKPLATLNINDQKGYILPGTERVYSSEWDNGFPYYKTTTADDGSTSTSLAIDWNNLTNFRFGLYTAKVVAIYNDGHGDIPIEKDVTFWVIPYKTIAAIIIILIVIGLLYSRWHKRRMNKAVKKALSARERRPKKSS